MVKKALFVGINYYATPLSRLNGCIEDVVNMRSMLMDAYGYDYSNIILLRDDIDNVNILPTKQNILNALNTLVTNSENATEIWFHYSGHGAMIQTTTIQADAVIIPSDFLISGYILDNDLYDIFKNAKCRCFLIFDSCNSGNIVELPWRYEYVFPGPIVKTNVNTHILANTEIYMFAGCKETQNCEVIYSIDDADYVGVFTEAFLTCLRRNKHEVNLLQLYTDICVYLTQKQFTQIPIFTSSILDPSYSFIREGSCQKTVLPKQVNLSKMLFN